MSYFIGLEIWNRFSVIMWGVHSSPDSISATWWNLGSISKVEQRMSYKAASAQTFASCPVRVSAMRTGGQSWIHRAALLLINLIHLKSGQTWHHNVANIHGWKWNLKPFQHPHVWHFTHRRNTQEATQSERRKTRAQSGLEVGFLRPHTVAY